MTETASNSRVTSVTLILCEIIEDSWDGVDKGYVGAVVGMPGCASQNDSEEELLKDLASCYRDFIELGAVPEKEPTFHWYPKSKLAWADLSQFPKSNQSEGK